MKDKELQDTLISKRLSINIPLLPENEDDKHSASLLALKQSKYFCGHKN